MYIYIHMYKHIYDLSIPKMLSLKEREKKQMENFNYNY